MNLVSTARQSESTADVQLGSYADLASEYYDARRHPTCANFREASAVFLAEELAAFNPRGGLVAEIGAGRSLVAEIMAGAALARSRLVLIDASHEMLAHSVKWLSAGALGTVADARQLPIGRHSVELGVVPLGDAFNNCAFWSEVARVLRPGGLCLFTVPAFAWAQEFRLKSLALGLTWLNSPLLLVEPSRCHHSSCRRIGSEKWLRRWASSYCVNVRSLSARSV